MELMFFWWTKLLNLLICQPIKELKIVKSNDFVGCRGDIGELLYQNSEKMLNNADLLGKSCIFAA